MSWGCGGGDEMKKNSFDFSKVGKNPPKVTLVWVVATAPSARRQLRRRRRRRRCCWWFASTLAFHAPRLWRPKWSSSADCPRTSSSPSRCSSACSGWCWGWASDWRKRKRRRTSGTSVRWWWRTTRARHCPRWPALRRFPSWSPPGCSAPHWGCSQRGCALRRGSWCAAGGGRQRRTARRQPAGQNKIGVWVSEGSLSGVRIIKKW